VRLRFLGHACFVIEFKSGNSLLIDPYEPNGLGGKLRYRPLPVEPSWVLISHAHRDHSDTSWLAGEFEIIEEGVYPDFTVEVFEADHDEFGGALRGGKTKLFLIEFEGVRCLHCGDLGERLTRNQIAAFGGVDILIVPVGGYFTLGPAGASELVDVLQPTCVVPCHYGGPGAEIPELQPLSIFLRRFRGGPSAIIESGALSSLPVGYEAPTIVTLSPEGQPEPRPNQSS